MRVYLLLVAALTDVGDDRVCLYRDRVDSAELCHSRGVVSRGDQYGMLVVYSLEQMKRYCDHCNRKILSEQTVYELRIENRDKGILDRETLCPSCLTENY